MEHQISNIYKVNPALARKMFWFALTSMALFNTMWGFNLGVLAYNLLVTEMIWQVALILFCVTWLVIYTGQRVIMAPIGKSIARAVTEIQLDALEDIGNDMMRQVDTTEYLRNKKEQSDE